MRAQINCKIDPYTISGSVLCTHLSPESRAATSRVSRGGRGPKCHVDVSQTREICRWPNQIILFATPCWRAPKRAKQLSTVATLPMRFMFRWPLHDSRSPLQSWLSHVSLTALSCGEKSRKTSGTRVSAALHQQQRLFALRNTQINI